MKSFAVVSALAATLSTAVAGYVPRQSTTIPKADVPVTVRGNAFFRGNDRFFMRGVAYQPGGAADAKDPLLDITGLKRDVENFKKLGINTVRVYTVDNSKNHDEGMKILADAGIYLALDANTPFYSINRETEATMRRSYNDVYLQSVFATVEAFHDYPNTLLFFSGNEVINQKNNTVAAPYIKAVTRDMKTFIANRSPRAIPVGYSAADVAENIEQQALYFNCGADTDRSDFFAFNDYSFCNSDFEVSGWKTKVETYSDYSRPLFLSEYGCIEPKPRAWKEVASLYHTNMTAVYSGGLAYEYTEEPNGYGLVKLEGGKITPNDDFDVLKEAFEETPIPSQAGEFNENGSASQCPPEDDQWEVTTTDLPSMPVNAQKYMEEGAGTGPGLEGSSHFAGEETQGTATPGSNQPTRTPNGQAAGNGNGGTGAGMVVEVPMRFVGMIAASVLFGMVLVF